MPLFALGQVLATAAVNQDMERLPSFKGFCLASLERHIVGDWGDVCNEDYGSNEAALVQGSRLVSVYKTPELPDALPGVVPGEKIWIITEASREATTILYPSDY